MPYTSDKRLYLNADRSKIVEEDDPDAAHLLVAAGGQVSDVIAKQYNLKAKEKSEAKADDAGDEKPEAKQVSSPPENKSKSAAEATKDK